MVIAQAETHGQGKSSAPFQARGNEVLAFVVSRENRGPYARIRDQGGSQILANVGHIHDVEHRFASPRFDDKLGDGHYGFGRKLAYKTELVAGDDDASDCIFWRGLRHLQLPSGVSETDEVSGSGQTHVIAFDQAAS